MPTVLCHFLSLQRWATIGDAIPHDEYTPTRDSSTPDGSLFSYKYTSVEISATAITRGEIPMYNPCIFGEVTGIYRENGRLRVRIRCPNVVSEDGHKRYLEQLRVLETLLAMEEKEEDGEIRSWFDHPGTKAGVEGALSIHISARDVNRVNDLKVAVGMGVAVWVFIRRINRPEGKHVHRTYRLDVDYFADTLPLDTLL
ncbi:hypothetical protein DFH06DRAFT_1348023 [Mycena polygramma]|nr:hypothetical protein DFH06DRAFT_1348023 [Mycena polygramma]